MFPSSGFRLKIFVAAAAIALSCSRAAPQRERINPGTPVIIISIDTLRSDHLPAYGYPGGHTPHLDAFRRDSILFRNAYSNCPLTLPSHLSALTGLLLQEHGTTSDFDSTARSIQPSRRICELVSRSPMTARSPMLTRS